MPISTHFQCELDRPLDFKTCCETHRIYSWIATAPNAEGERRNQRARGTAEAPFIVFVARLLRLQTMGPLFKSGAGWRLAANLRGQLRRRLRSTRLDPLINATCYCPTGEGSEGKFIEATVASASLHLRPPLKGLNFAFT